MGRLGRSWALAGASWRVLRADKELLALPVLSAVASLVTLAVFALPIWRTVTVTELADGTSEVSPSPLTFVGVALVYFLMAYVTVFFNTALVHAADERLRGGDPSLGSALRGAASRALAILPWALLSATVTMVLSSLKERSGVLGRVVLGLIGVAWQLVTFLVLPVLVVEGVGVRHALKRSASLFRDTWGENVVANVALGVFGMIAGLIALPLLMAAVWTGHTPTIVATSVAFVLWIAVVSIVLSALGVVYQVALYRYAVLGEAPPAFAGVDLAGAFAPKGDRS